MVSSALTKVTKPTQPNATAKTASGYRVMGLPGTAPGGYKGFSYNRKLARERTKRGYLG